MNRWTSTPTTTLALLAALAGVAVAGESPGAAADQVRAREVAFARTMADRNHAAFATFLSNEAIFVDSSVLQGRDAVAEGWLPLFAGEKAPFSWRPERVVVTASGDLALSTGPVFNPEGERIGTFNSTWRLEDDGEWRVVLDIGCPPCRSSEDAPAQPADAEGEPDGRGEP